MKASLGVSMPNPTPKVANFIMQGYADPATEIIKLSSIGVPIGAPLVDGTQIWKVTHNGVDTHPIHFHLFHVQVINRVGWDGAYRLPRPETNSAGRTRSGSTRSRTPTWPSGRSRRCLHLPWKVPEQLPAVGAGAWAGSPLGFTNIDPLGNPITPASRTSSATSAGSTCGTATSSP